MSDIISTIDEYIAAQPEVLRPLLVRVRETIGAAAPDAVEKISWGMPTFWQHENLIHFAAQKKHLGIYPGDLSRIPFADRLSDYHTSKGAIQFPYNRPVDYGLIAEITAFRVATVTRERGGAVGNAARMYERVYEYEATIQKVPDQDGSYVVFPYDVRAEFGRGRVKVHATFDGEPYDGSVVNMGVKNPDGTVCYIIGIRKSIREKLGKQPGDSVRMTISERP